MLPFVAYAHCLLSQGSSSKAPRLLLTLQHLAVLGQVTLQRLLLVTVQQDFCPIRIAHTTCIPHSAWFLSCSFQRQCRTSSICSHNNMFHHTCTEPLQNSMQLPWLPPKLRWQ